MGPFFVYDATANLYLAADLGGWVSARHEGTFFIGHHEAREAGRRFAPAGHDVRVIEYSRY